MNGKTILLVEDSEKVQNYNKRMLEDEGFAIESALTLSDAGAYLEKRRPDAIILDIGMPDGNGLEFLKELRRTSKIPVLMLTGYDKNEDIVNGFKSGCDDYLPKPYTFEVLLARLNKLLLSAEQMPERIHLGLLTIDVFSGQAYLNGEDMLLTQKEFSLLVLFTQHEGRSMSAEYVYEKVWGQPLNHNAGAVKNQVSNLRRKLEGSGYTISSTRGEGYRFERE